MSGGIEEHCAKALVERLLMQGGALVGDRHEVMAGVLAVEPRSRS